MTLAKRILLFAVALIAVIMLAVGYLIEGRLYERMIDERVEGLAREARLVSAQWADHNDPQELVSVASTALGGRVTLIDRNGLIVADAMSGGEPLQTPGSRARRPEVEEAQASALGVSVGVSPTGDWEELYVAVAGERGITRVAVTTVALQQIFQATRSELATVWFAALGVAALLALAYARYVSRPVIELRDLAKGLAARDFRERKLTPAPGEVGELAHSLQELATRLEALERVRREFVANVSHELKTPLTIAGGYAATLVKDGAASDSQRQFALSILNNTTRMQRIVDDLLDLSKIESGAWTPELEPVELVAVAEELVDTLRPQAAAANVELTVAIDGDATQVVADRTALRQVLANLVENAIRHAQNGSVTIFSEAGTQGTWVGVRDTGAGIDAEHLPRIFERFYRVDSARSRKSGGTGLGLAIVKHLCEAHGGHVEATSTRGAGTTIRAFFPDEPGKRRTPSAASVPAGAQQIASAPAITSA